MTALASAIPNGRQTVVTAQPAANDSPIANLIDVGRFEQLQRLATLMAHSSLTPKHLRGSSQQEAVGNCFRIANQAIRWGFDPFAVADESYVVSGKLGYQGKLVAAVINSRAGLKQNLSVEYVGDGDNRTATITGWFKSESSPRTIELSAGQAKTDNQMWKKDPDQKLFYSATVKWARRHCPEIVMGVLTDDELELMRAGASARAVEASGPLALPQGRSRIKKPKAAEEVATTTLAEGEIPNEEADRDSHPAEEPGNDDATTAQDSTGAHGPSVEQEAMAADFVDEIRESGGDKSAVMRIGGRIGKAREALGPLYDSVKAAYMEAMKTAK